MVQRIPFCDQCGAANRPTARFCRECGQPLLHCDQCKAANRPTARFCRECGQPLLPSLLHRQISDVVQIRKTLDVIICYAHEDEVLRDGLIKQLHVLFRQGLIDLWHDRDISAGAEWEHEIDTHLNKAHIILLLVSPDFIASDYCYGTEMKRAIERHENGEARVIPIILRPVSWQRTPLGKLQALPADAKPVMASTWRSLDEAFFNVAEGIREVVENFPDKAKNNGEPLVQSTEERNIVIREPLSSAKSTILSAKYVGAIFGSYRLTRLIGAGGFAEVYLSEHIHSGISAAIKIMVGPLIGSSADEFLETSRNIARLVHPHIIRVLDFGLEGSIPFLVMDYASNGSLREHYPKGTQLSLSTIIRYVNQIADGLQFVHGKRLIHGDLKPENVLLSASNEIWLSDFSLDVDTITQHNNPLDAMATTIPYMAPEQLNGIRKPESDQYALGIMVYEWLSGSRPFTGSAFEIITQHMVARPPTLKDKVKVPLSVESVVLKALAKDRNRRFTSIREFATSLEQASKNHT